MTRNPLRTIRFAVAILALAFIEWVLFELLRAPYRPPEDMTTFLGTEKYAVIAFMMLLAGVGLGFMCWWAARSACSMLDALAPRCLSAIVEYLFARIFPDPP